jgi:hypothetical protein
MGNEPSTQEFLNCIHKDPDLSLMHITAITEKCVKDKVINKTIILSMMLTLLFFLVGLDK